MERSFTNLLSNAIKYSDKGKTIDIGVSTNQNLVTVEVRDQGYGIMDKELPFIFERFRRQQETEQRGPKGAGLGLNFVKVVVEKHKGDISVDSVYGEGSCFTLRLPILGNLTH